jgi:hypothetical protein
MMADTLRLWHVIGRLDSRLALMQTTGLAQMGMKNAMVGGSGCVSAVRMSGRGGVEAAAWAGSLISAKTRCGPIRLPS